jgi:hypothetical protein
MRNNGDEPINFIELGRKGLNGLTKREYFAGLAMQGLMACSVISASRKEIAEEAVKQADDLLEELEKTKSE